MNNYRRNVLSRAEKVLDDIHGEIEILAADEQTGEAGNADQLTNRVKGWQSRLEDVHSNVETIKDEEEDAAENTRSEERQDAMREAVSQMESFLCDAEELYSLEDTTGFCEMWHSKYDSMISQLQEAGQ